MKFRFPNYPAFRKLPIVVQIDRVMDRLDNAVEVDAGRVDFLMEAHTVVAPRVSDAVRWRVTQQIGQVIQGELNKSFIDR